MSIKAGENGIGIGDLLEEGGADVEDGVDIASSFNKELDRFERGPYVA